MAPQFTDGLSIIALTNEPFLARFECPKGHVNYIDSSESEPLTDGRVMHFFPDLYGCWCKRRYFSRDPYLCESAHEKAELMVAYEAYMARAIKHPRRTLAQTRIVGTELAPPNDPGRRRS